MTENDKGLLAEIDRLREDVKQLREIVNVLVNVVMEEDMEEEEPEFPSYPGNENRFNIYN
ncbi:MAG: hypothetical protein KJ653_03370 [Candidatus Thermoplasmatota archaeon]|nr:hypothetical protein [Candidatus Thermoplasmatota archaeon]MBU1913713.1 hypothetical protein [Candidatus Thermoplasmatota archaeon]